MPTAPMEITAAAESTATHVKSAPAHSTVEAASDRTAVKTTAHGAAVESSANCATVKSAANHSSTETTADWHRMKSTCRNPTVETTTSHTPVETTRYTTMEPARSARMKSTTVNITAVESTMESAVVKTVVDMETVMDKPAMREETAVREKDSVEPARKWIEEWARVISAVIISRIIGIRAAVISTDIGDRRSGLRGVIRTIRTRGRIGRRLGNHRRLGWRRVGIRRRRHRRSMSLFAYFSTTFKHGGHHGGRNAQVPQLDDFVRRRLKRPGRILDERQNNRLIHAGFRERNNLVDPTGKLRSSAGRNRAGGIARLSGIRLNRARGKTGTGDHAAKDKEWEKPRLHNHLTFRTGSIFGKIRLNQSTSEMPDFQGENRLPLTPPAAATYAFCSPPRPVAPLRAAFPRND